MRFVIRAFEPPDALFRGDPSQIPGEQARNLLLKPLAQRGILVANRELVRTTIAALPRAGQDPGQSADWLSHVPLAREERIGPRKKLKSPAQWWKALEKEVLSSMDWQGTTPAGREQRWNLLMPLALASDRVVVIDPHALNNLAGLVFLVERLYRSGVEMVEVIVKNPQGAHEEEAWQQKLDELKRGVRPGTRSGQSLHVIQSTRTDLHDRHILFQHESGSGKKYTAVHVGHGTEAFSTHPRQHTMNRCNTKATLDYERLARRREDELPTSRFTLADGEWQARENESKFNAAPTRASHG